MSNDTFFCIVVYQIEWLTVKNGHLYLGSPGDSLRNYWVHIITRKDIIKSDWESVYKLLNKKIEITNPSEFIINKTCVWNDSLQKFYFLPNKPYLKKYNMMPTGESEEPENDEKDESANLILSRGNNFKSVTVKA